MTSLNKKILQIIIPLVIVYGGILGYASHMLWQEKVDNPTAYLVQKVENCQKENGANSCYRDLTSDFLKKFGQSIFFEIIAANEKQKSIFQSCHEMMHFAGREAYYNMDNVAVALANGSSLCFSGFYHGVLEAHLIAQRNTSDDWSSVLKQLVPDLCKKKYFSIVQDMNECLHGLGHALMFATETELPESLKLCDALKTEADRGWCYSGVFMENSTSSTNKDHPSRFLKKEDPLYPCSVLAERYLTMCYTLQGFYFAEISDFDWEKTAEWCRKIPNNYRGACFNAIGQSQVGFTQDMNVMNKNCSSIPELLYRNSCIIGIVGALGERYPHTLSTMFNFCSFVDPQETPACYGHALIMAQQRISEKDNINKLCALIPEGRIRTNCQGTVYEP